MDNDGALEADAIERLHLTMDAIPHTIGWRAAFLWSRHVAMDPSSHTWRAINGKRADFANPAQQNELLASIYDVVATQLSLMSSFQIQRNGFRRPKPYPRPYRSKNAKTYGRDPIEIKKFDSWYYGR